MYERYFGFHQRPFSVTPDPAFYYPSAKHREALHYLNYGITQRMGFIVLTGEVGCGKTLLVRLLLAQLDEQVRRALILNPQLGPDDLLRTIMDDLGLPAEDGDSRKQLLDRFNRFLFAEHEAERTVVVIIDEAQDLDVETLESLRLLSNIETPTAKLLQIVLVGQPELAAVLDQPKVRQLKQRVTVRTHLQPLTREEVSEYIEHRLRIAGGGGNVTFARGALDRIHEYSGGVPRLIGTVCDQALLVAFSCDARKIDAGIINEVIAGWQTPSQQTAASDSQTAQQQPPSQKETAWAPSPMSTPEFASGSSQFFPTGSSVAPPPGNIGVPIMPVPALPGTRPARRRRGSGWLVPMIVLGAVLMVVAAMGLLFSEFVQGELFAQPGVETTQQSMLPMAAPAMPPPVVISGAEPTAAGASREVAAVAAVAEETETSLPTYTPAPETETPTQTPQEVPEEALQETLQESPQAALEETPTGTPTATATSEPMPPAVEDEPIPQGAALYLIPSGQALDLEAENATPRYAVQAACFRSPEQALVSGRELRQTYDLPVYVVEDRTALGEWHRVLVGSYATPEESREKAREINALAHYNDAFSVVNKWYKAQEREAVE